MHTRIETITPERASQLLARNLNVRNLTESHVKFLMLSMPTWRLNGEAS